jgi:RNA polymerase sigma-70 factor (ECF subfamily)
MAERGNEREWIIHARQGDDNAFANLVEAYQVPVYNLCCRMLGDPDQAEDAAQETFLKVYRGLKRYDPNRPFTTWLLSIASHHCIDRLRRRRIPAISLSELLPNQQKPDDSPGPEAVLAISEHQQAVRGMLEHLGNRDRVVIVLRYWYELSYDEIAQTLSTSVSSVKSRLHRARRQLARYWMEQEIVALATRGKCDEPSAV